MGRWSLTAAIVNGVIGSGVFGLPSAVAALTGAWSPVAVLIAGACVFLVILCFAEVGSRFDDAGGPYLYAREAFGPIVGISGRVAAARVAPPGLRRRAEHSHRVPGRARAAGRHASRAGPHHDRRDGPGHRHQRHRRAHGGVDDQRVHGCQAASTRAAHRAGVAAASQRRARLAGRRTSRLDSSGPAAGVRVRRIRIDGDCRERVARSTEGHRTCADRGRPDRHAGLLSAASRHRRRAAGSGTHHNASRVGTARGARHEPARRWAASPSSSQSMDG